MTKIKRRNPALVIIFSIITFGIYELYWFVKTKNEINGLGAEIPTAWLLIIPIANIYLIYKYCEGFTNYIKKGESTIVWFLLWLVISPVAMILIQLELNKLAE
ncbi:MAG: DUF4234 domain-containing protein [Euryarchaeota archaeon]|nr:DUF4234 domain-containing protein [Euryarchaeota archaeon]